MKRRWMVFRALLKCGARLFFHPWRWESSFVGWDGQGRIIYVAATKGSLSDGSLRVKRVFYNTNQ